MFDFDDEIERKLIELLRWRDTISAKEIAAALRTNTRQVQALISHMIEAPFVPICSNTRDGFWLARSWEDIEETRNQLESRRTELKKRSDALVLAGEEWLGNQITFKLEAG